MKVACTKGFGSCRNVAPFSILMMKGDLELNKVLKVDEERIDFLIELLLKTKYVNETDKIIAKEIYTDLSILGLED